MDPQPGLELACASSAAGLPTSRSPQENKRESQHNRDKRDERDDAKS